MKTYVKTPKEPKEVVAYACGECAHVYLTSASALSCCKQSYCQTCGEECYQAWIKCSACRDTERWQKAQEIQTHDGPVCDYENDLFFSSYDEALEHYQDLVDDGEKDSIPEFIHPGKEIPFPGVDPGSIYERLTQDWEEGAEKSLRGCEEFEKACAEFNERNKGLVTWDYDASRKIKVVLETQNGT